MPKRKHKSNAVRDVPKEKKVMPQKPKEQPQSETPKTTAKCNFLIDICKAGLGIILVIALVIPFTDLRDIDNILFHPERPHSYQPLTCNEWIQFPWKPGKNLWFEGWYYKFTSQNDQLIVIPGIFEVTSFSLCFFVFSFFCAKSQLV